VYLDVYIISTDGSAVELVANHLERGF
jgi:hypothetical protein